MAEAGKAGKKTIASNLATDASTWTKGAPVEVASSGQVGMCFGDETIGFINRSNVECERKR